MNDDFVLPLYRLAREAPAADFQRFALESLAARLNFRSAFWGQGRFLPDGAGVVAQDAYLDKVDPDFLRGWLEMNQQDGVVGLLDSNPGRAFAIHVPTFFASAPEYAALGARHSITNIAAVTAPRPGSSRDVMWLCLYGSSPAEMPSDTDLAWLEGAMPHLQEAWLLNRAVHGANLRHPGQPCYFAVADKATGAIIKCEAGFIENAAKSWPGFDSEVVPIAVRKRWDQLQHFSFPGRTGHFEGTCRGELVFLSFELYRESARITARQIEIATLFCDGMAYKKIAALMNIAPATVRNHLAAVYDSLGVHTRDELKVALRSFKRNADRSV